MTAAVSARTGTGGVPGYDGTGHRGGQDDLYPVQGTEDQPADT